MFRSQQIIIREYVCTSLKLLNYLKNTEFKILKINPGVVAAIHVAGVCGDPCGAVHWTTENKCESPMHSTTRVTMYTCYMFCCHNTGNDLQSFKFNVFF